MPRSVRTKHCYRPVLHTEVAKLSLHRATAAMAAAATLSAPSLTSSDEMHLTIGIACLAPSFPSYAGGGNEGGKERREGLSRVVEQANRPAVHVSTYSFLVPFPLSWPLASLLNSLLRRVEAHFPKPKK
jgi:hypothetical protein